MAAVRRRHVITLFSDHLSDMYLFDALSTSNIFGILWFCFFFLTVEVICLTKHLGRSLMLRFLSITFRFVVAGSTFRNPLETLIVKTKEQ